MGRLLPFLVVQFLVAERLRHQREGDGEVTVGKAGEAQHAQGALGSCDQSSA